MAFQCIRRTFCIFRFWNISIGSGVMAVRNIFLAFRSIVSFNLLNDLYINPLALLFCHFSKFYINEKYYALQCKVCIYIRDGQGGVGTRKTPKKIFCRTGGGDSKNRVFKKISKNFWVFLVPPPSDPEKL